MHIHIYLKAAIRFLFTLSPPPPLPERKFLGMKKVSKTELNSHFEKGDESWSMSLGVKVFVPEGYLIIYH